ncbi:hypothetical protein CHS0354_019967 [Potamilus streckersoni]|uniref:Uncharacterized protein n=1 Tax=Potamilus streckersoni TaxID=2493646 RepID=A0AAE0S0C1_9BIVA|nr:hypothetical protein CHS0354_019967 [Potamilus streckersoni]
MNKLRKMSQVFVLVLAAILALASAQFQQFQQIQPNTFYPGSGYSGYSGSLGYPGGYQPQQYGTFPVNTGAYYPTSSGSFHQGYVQPMQGGYWLGNSHPIVKQVSYVPFNGDYWSGQSVQVRHYPVPYPVPAPVPVPYPTAQSGGIFGLDVRAGTNLMGMVLAGVVAGLVAKNG